MDRFTTRSVKCSKKELDAVVRSLVGLSERMDDCGRPDKAVVANSYSYSLLSRWNAKSQTLELDNHSRKWVKDALDAHVRAAASLPFFSFGRKKRVQEAKALRDQLTDRLGL